MTDCISLDVAKDLETAEAVAVAVDPFPFPDARRSSHCSIYCLLRAPSPEIVNRTCTFTYLWLHPGECQVGDNGDDATHLPVSCNSGRQCWLVQFPGGFQLVQSQIIPLPLCKLQLSDQRLDLGMQHLHRMQWVACVVKGEDERCEAA